MKIDKVDVYIALWDIKAKAAGMPLYTLLGGSQKRIPIYGSGGWTSYTEKELISEVEQIQDWGYTKIKSKITIPVATGEQEYTKYGARDLILNHAVDVIQMDATKCGGITEWLKIAAIAQAWNIPFAPHV